MTNDEIRRQLGPFPPFKEQPPGGDDDLAPDDVELWDIVSEWVAPKAQD